MRRHRRWLAALVLLGLVLALPLLLNLDVFLGRVHQALERQLGRPVEVRSLTGYLLPRPGFVGRGVIVHEQEGFGAEPFLYAEEVRCHLAPRALWTLRLECGQIDFVRPSVNLVRNRERVWNLGEFRLGGAAPGPADSPRAGLPLVTAREARINFKFGDDKQVFALLASRLQVEPQPDGSWQISMRATPMRTDRRLSEIGAVTLDGTVARAAEAGAGPRFRFNLELERGSLAQLWTLLAGREPPLRAAAALTATLQGTPEEWRAQGSFTVSELRRWDLVAPPDTPFWTTEFRALARGADSPLVLESVTVRGGQTVLTLAGSVANLFGQPSWELEARSERISLAELAAQLAAFRENVSPGARLEGEARLNLRLRGPLQDWQGEWTIPAGAQLHLPELSPVEISPCTLRLARGRLELSPLTLRYPEEFSLGLRGELNLASPLFPYHLQWESEAVRLDALRRTAAAFGWSLFGPARWRGRAVMALEWRGQVKSEQPAVWQGDVALTDANYQPPELNFPIDIPEARLSWRGARFEARPLKVRLGEDVLSFTLEHQGRSNRWQLSGEGPRLQLETLDEALNPSRQGLISRLVRPTPRREPAWKGIDLAGTIKVDEVFAGPFRLAQLEAKGEWQGGSLELTQLRFRAHGGRFDGRLHADFRGDAPRYRLAGNLKQVNLAELLAADSRLAETFDGLLGADLALESTGLRSRDLLQGLRGRVVGVVQNGAIRHISLVDAMAAAAGGTAGEEEGSTATALQSLAGEFQVAEEKVRLDGVRMITSRAALELSGTVDFEGQLNLRLVGEPLRVSGRRISPAAARALANSYRLTGTLRRPRVEVGEPLPAAPVAGR
ncbi:MAG: AsmA-like C-terminal region-containing protein [Candidatus Acidiferrales bacterium]